MKNNFLALLLILFFATTSQSQQNPEPVNDAEKREVIDSISRQLTANYVFPEVATQMSTLINDNLKQGKYKALADPQQLADQLTKDLQSISHDKHLRVMYNPEQIAEMRSHNIGNDNEEIPAEWIARAARSNFGFQEVKILEGNVGYLDLRGFFDTKYAGETAAAAMSYLSNADALVIDLRKNGGGSPSMIQLITSYLYDAEPVHLNNFYYRPTDENTQTWTLPYVPGKRRPDVDVYVLTSSYTFSAAEEFSYNLQNLKRATLIGETTGGGAHPGGTQIATDRFLVWVPTGRAINPITNTNWEGTGVKPHIEIAAAQALDKAHLEALQALAKKTADENQKAYYEWYLPMVQNQINPVTVAAKTLESYAGKYGSRTLSYENGKLFYQREDRPKFELHPLTEDLFFIEEAPGFRLRIEQQKGVATALTGLYDDGHSDQSPKDDVKP